MSTTTELVRFLKDKKILLMSNTRKGKKLEATIIEEKGEFKVFFVLTLTDKKNKELWTKKGYGPTVKDLDMAVVDALIDD